MPNTLENYRTPDTNKAMGIEIECYFPFQGWNVPESQRLAVPPEYQYVGFFYMGTDGSIESPRYEDAKREMVSQPLSAPWLKKEIRKLGRKYQWKHNGSCGIHIHVSRKWLSEKRAKMIWEFLKAQKEEDLYDWFGRGGNDYCRYYDVRSDWSRRYQAVNTQPQYTVEFRMFASGGPEWACYCVDMVKYLVENAPRLNTSAVAAFRDMWKGERE